MFSIQQCQQGRVPRPHPKNKTLAFCAKLIAHLENTKAHLIKEFSQAPETYNHVLHLALNEAEALAWESGVPQLVFPTLAREKAEAVVAWSLRQRSLNSMGLMAKVPA